MIEHVGRKNLHYYMEGVNSMLVQGGVSLLHCITAQTESEVNEWIKRYIFPGGYIPSIRELVSLMADNNLHLVDVESLRLHYIKRLRYGLKILKMLLTKLVKLKDDRFIRMWDL